MYSKTKMKTGSKYMLFKRTHFRSKGMHKLKVKEWKKIFHANNRKQ